MKADRELIDKIAELARLEFNEQEKEKISHDLSRMIEMVEKLSELNTDAIKPLRYIHDEQNVFREDEVKEFITKEEALMNVPVKNDDYILVPKVIKK